MASAGSVEPGQVSALTASDDSVLSPEESIRYEVSSENADALKSGSQRTILLS
eukprot:IDg4795t1